MRYYEIIAEACERPARTVVRINTGPLLLNPSRDDLAAMFDYVGGQEDRKPEDDIVLRFVIDHNKNVGLASGYTVLHDAGGTEYSLTTADLVSNQIRCTCV